MKNKYDLIAKPDDFPAAIARAAKLGQMDALSAKPRQTSTQKVVENVCTRWYRGQAFSIKIAYNGGFWNAENVMSGKIKFYDCPQLPPKNP